MGMKPRITPAVIEAWGVRVGSPAPDVKVTVIDPIRGITLGSFDFLPELKDIKEKLGVGYFKLVVARRDDRGSLVYAASKRVTVE